MKLLQIKVHTFFKSCTFKCRLVFKNKELQLYSRVVFIYISPLTVHIEFVPLAIHSGMCLHYYLPRTTLAHTFTIPCLPTKANTAFLHIRTSVWKNAQLTRSTTKADRRIRFRPSMLLTNMCVHKVFFRRSSEQRMITHKTRLIYELIVSATDKSFLGLVNVLIFF